MRKVLTIALVLFMSVQERLAAQEASRWQAGVLAEAGLPLGDFSENHKAGLGGHALLVYQFKPDIQFSLSAGYLYFRGKAFDDDYLSYRIDDWKALPVRIGVKHFVTDHFYLKGESGAVFFLEPGSGTSIILSPGLGIHLNSFDMGLKLESWTTSGTVSFAALNLGYFF